MSTVLCLMGRTFWQSPGSQGPAKPFAQGSAKPPMPQKGRLPASNASARDLLNPLLKGVNQPETPKPQKGRLRGV